MLIPNSEIQEIPWTSNRRAWRIGQIITVTAGKGKDNEWHFCCHTCPNRNDACAHTRAVRRYAKIPMRKVA